MAVPSAEQFEREAYRGIGHVKSSELKDVIKKLRLYHADRTVSHTLHAHLLIDLRDSVTAWGQKDPKEFAARHGPELAHEVMVALASSDQEHLKLVNGDILFRWVPRGIDQRGKIQIVSAKAQGIQDDKHRRAGLEGINVEVSSMVVLHVGIYADDSAIEIGPGGLLRIPMINRPHYDLVVRSRVHGTRIANAARSARRGPAYRRQRINVNGKDWLAYPAWDLWTGACQCTLPGALFLDQQRILLQQDDTQYRDKGQGNFLQQRVICSHFVNAVLYAAVRPGGTIATATDHAYDEIFKVGPAQMWGEFLHRRGLWSKAHAVFVGLQHKGNLDRNIDPRTLGVGLRQPPVPKRAGRPRLSRQPGH